MIFREWRGRAPRARANAYPEHFRSKVVPELRGIAGFIGAYLLVHDIEGAIEFTVITQWVSMDAVTAFAGKDASRAVVEPGAVEALRDFDETVTHHELIEQVSGGAD